MSLAFLKGMAKFKVPTLFLLQLGAVAFLGSLTGCYTQLYSRGYAERAAANYPEYYRAPSVSGDTLAPSDSAGWARADSLRKADSLQSLDESGRRLADGSGNGSVIVNNYYQESPYYRGYLIQDWNYPTLAFGIYSSRYRDYYGPYWWDDPWYRSGGGYHRSYHGDRGHNGRNGGYDPPAGGGGGPYGSDKRIFTPAPDHELRKGRRAEPVQQPAPKYGSDNASSSSSSGSGSSSNSGSSSGSSSSSSGSSSGSGAAEKDDHPTVQKGKRR